jgi:hypothetical protein
LKESGALSDAEFQAAKSRILQEGTKPPAVATPVPSKKSKDLTKGQIGCLVFVLGGLGLVIAAALWFFSGVKDTENEMKAENAVRLRPYNEALGQVGPQQADAIRKLCGQLTISWDSFAPTVAADYVKTKANDPDAIDVKNCTALRFDKEHCWLTDCDVRAKNAFGAKILKRIRFSIGRDPSVETYPLVLGAEEVN